MTRFSELMSGQTLLPLIQADTAEQGVNIAKAMAAAGLGLVEVVLRTDASLAAIKAIKEAVPSLKVGAGTVINAEILQQALDAGSDFIVTPAVSPSLLAALKECPVPVVRSWLYRAKVISGFTIRRRTIFKSSFNCVPKC